MMAAPTPPALSPSTTNPCNKQCHLISVRSVDGRRCRRAWSQPATARDRVCRGDHRSCVHGKAKLDSPSYVLTIQRPAVERFVQAPDWLFFLLLLFTQQLTAPHEASNSMATVSSPLLIWCFLFSVVFSAFGPWLLARRRRKGGKDDSKLPVLFTFSLGLFCRRSRTRCWGEFIHFFFFFA
jgi:hypothetical protein